MGGGGGGVPLSFFLVFVYPPRTRLPVSGVCTWWVAAWSGGLSGEATSNARSTVSQIIFTFLAVSSSERNFTRSS